MMQFYDTLRPYKVLDYKGIQYGVCRDFNHISRYRGLRQLVHEPQEESRFIALETPNPFVANNVEVDYYEVTAVDENRLDLVAYKTLGNANYSWIIAYFNNIEDGFTIIQGQKLMIPKNISSLFNKGEILQSVSPITLNLGTE